ncbi:type II secretion system F family protein [Kineosporia succinea]|uniref:Type IV pilus assembly protein PilC n=1 Tax=Kineosporia succinea TaxID=84632 RepID=A0ABT9NV62_9ACTN|nr:type II secretion system F family protein [Kineosporia succinea]MDP9824316.1 type IV pilus assembly protein PilC [Kineosporia succinea]
MATATAAKTYEYKYRDRQGKLVKGKLEAPSEDVLIQRLRQQGYAPLDVKQANTGLNVEIKMPGSNKVDLKDLAIMSRQFATMIDSGLSLLKALSILAEQTESKPLAKTLNEVRSDVEGGSSLSAAMAKHTKVFPPLMINMCRAGEVGGFLDAVLLQIAANMESEVKLRAKIKSAMTYPVVVFIMAILAVVGMLLFIVPVFTNMFASLGGTLPAPTRALVFLSAAMKVAAPIIVVLAVPGSVIWNRNKHKEGVRRVVDPLKLKVPIFGDLFRKVAISRFSRNLGTMLHAGVPILRSLEIVGEAAGNVVLRDAAKAVGESVQQGKPLAAPLAEHKVFPPMVVQMLAVGEDTGAMDSMLHKISEFYDQEVEATTEALTSIIEPLMIAVLGSLIGGMIIALYMPIFSVFNLIT